MSKQSIIFLVSLWIVLVPFLGLPLSWETFLVVASGLAIATLTFLEIARKRFEGANFPRESGFASHNSSFGTNVDEKK